MQVSIALTVFLKIDIFNLFSFVCLHEACHTEKECTVTESSYYIKSRELIRKPKIQGSTHALIDLPINLTELANTSFDVVMAHGGE
jgi:hypothetical protein